MPVASRIFLRNDVQPAVNAINVSYTDEELFNAVKKYGWGYKGYSVEGGLSNKFSLIHRIQKSSFNAASSKNVSQSSHKLVKQA